MSVRRVEHGPEEQALKRASAAMIKAAGGVEAAAGFCRAGFRRLSEYGRPDTDCFAPIDVVAAIEQVTRDSAGWPHVTRHQARQLGFALVALPAARPVMGDLHQCLAAQAKEAGEVTTGVLDALADHKVTPAEARGLQAACVEAAEAAMRLHALLGEIGEGD